MKNGKLVDCISAKDLRVLLGKKAHLAPLFKTAKEFLQLKKERSDFKGQTTTCSPETPLKDVLEKFAKLKLHRVFVVDKDQKPIGVVSLGDVLRTVTATTKLNVIGKTESSKDDSGPLKMITGDEDIDRLIIAMNDSRGQVSKSDTKSAGKEKQEESSKKTKKVDKVKDTETKTEEKKPEKSKDV